MPKRKDPIKERERKERVKARKRRKIFNDFKRNAKASEASWLNDPINYEAAGPDVNREFILARKRAYKMSQKMVDFVNKERIGTNLSADVMSFMRQLDGVKTVNAENGPRIVHGINRFVDMVNKQTGNMDTQRMRREARDWADKKYGEGTATAVFDVRRGRNSVKIDELKKMIEYAEGETEAVRGHRGAVLIDNVIDNAKQAVVMYEQAVEAGDDKLQQAVMNSLPKIADELRKVPGRKAATPTGADAVWDSKVSIAGRAYAGELTDEQLSALWAYKDDEMENNQWSSERLIEAINLAVNDSRERGELKFTRTVHGSLTLVRDDAFKNIMADAHKRQFEYGWL